MGVVLRGVVLRATKAVVPAAALAVAGTAVVLASVSTPETTSLSYASASAEAPGIHGEPLGPVTVLTLVGRSLSLAADSASVELSRHGSTWSAALPPVRVVDARGTHAGWTVRWSLADVDVDGCRHSRLGASHVRVSPTTPVVVFGTPDGLEVGRPAVGTAKHRTLARAEAGSGGGTYEGGGTVSMNLPQCRAADSVVVVLTYAVS